MKKSYFYPAIICSLIMLLSACGFHLKGKVLLARPLQKMYLDTPDPYSYLAKSLQQNLRASGVLLVPSRTQADTVLSILRDENTQTLLSVSGSQQTRQYNLIATVVFQITDRNGAMLLPPQTLTENRVLTMQSNQILGSSNEANLYYQQMRRSLALAIMDRLASNEVTRLVNVTPPKVVIQNKSS